MQVKKSVHFKRGSGGFTLTDFVVFFHGSADNFAALKMLKNPLILVMCCIR